MTALCDGMGETITKGCGCLKCGNDSSWSAIRWGEISQKKPAKSVSLKPAKLVGWLTEHPEILDHIVGKDEESEKAKFLAGEFIRVRSNGVKKVRVRRFDLLELLAAGFDHEELATYYKVGQSTIRLWASKFSDYDIEVADPPRETPRDELQKAEENPDVDERKKVEAEYYRYIASLPNNRPLTENELKVYNRAWRKLEKAQRRNYKGRTSEINIDNQVEATYRLEKLAKDYHHRLAGDDGGRSDTKLRKEITGELDEAGVMSGQTAQFLDRLYGGTLRWDDVKLTGWYYCWSNQGSLKFEQRLEEFSRTKCLGRGECPSCTDWLNIKSEILRPYNNGPALSRAGGYSTQQDKKKPMLDLSQLESCKRDVLAELLGRQDSLEGRYPPAADLVIVRDLASAQYPLGDIREIRGGEKLIRKWDRQPNTERMYVRDDKTIAALRDWARRVQHYNMGKVVDITKPRWLDVYVLQRLDAIELEILSGGTTAFQVDEYEHWQHRLKALVRLWSQSRVAFRPEDHEAWRHRLRELYELRTLPRARVPGLVWRWPQSCAIAQINS